MSDQYRKTSKRLNPDEISARYDLTPVSKEVDERLTAEAKWLYKYFILPTLEHKPHPQTVGVYLDTIRFILMNFIRVDSMTTTGGTLMVVILTGNSSYGPKRLNKRIPKQFTGRIMRNCLNALESGGWIVSHGSRNYVDQELSTGEETEDGPHSSKVYKATGSRWSTTANLRNFFKAADLHPGLFKRGLGLRPSRVHVPKNLLKPKGKKIDLKEGPYTSERKAHDDGIRKANSLLQQAEITFDVPKESLTNARGERLPPCTLDGTKSTVCRVFSYDREHGGRFFGHFVQGLPKVVRQQHMLINGHKAKELDFKSFNITAIYNLEGLLLPRDFDPYTWEGSPLSRHEGKRVLVTVLNTRDKKQAVLAATSAIREDRKKENPQYDENSDPKLPQNVATFLDTCLARLTPEVRKYFYSDFGRKAMFYESEIAFRVLTRMADKGITVIPIHDSFMVEAQNVEELRFQMTEAFMEVFPDAPEPPTITDEN